MLHLASKNTQTFRDSLLCLLRGELPLSFHFQPIVDLRRGIAVGFEVLARFPDIIGLGPEAVFKAAHDMGRQVELEEILVRKALESRFQLPQDCFLSINVSPVLLVSDRWDHLLSDYPDMSGVVVEITEQNRIHDYDMVRAKLARIRAKGGSIAIDDTGSGYSSLKHVMELTPNFIKLDRFFVDGCHSEPAKLAMIEMIGQAADRLDAWIIAEGIELPPELDELMRLRVPMGQGYLLGRPAPAMATVPRNIVEMIRARVNPQAPETTVEPHAEFCPICTDRDDAIAQLQQDPWNDTAIVVDTTGRPTEMLRRHPDNGIQVVPVFMRVQASSELQNVLHRALTRSSDCRFDPLATINERGQFGGLLRLDRAMRAALKNTSV